MKILLVGFGGMIGALMRYLITCISMEKLGIQFPYGTLLANFIGCFVVGVVMGAIFEKSLLSENVRLLVVVGFAGGLTTFSSFSFETINLMQQQQYFLSMLNVSGNLFFGFLATLAGINLVRLF